MVDPYRIGRALNTNMHKVNDYIYIGNRSASEDFRTLNSENIVKVLQLLDFSILTEGQNIEVHYIKMEDSESQDISFILPEALRYIQYSVNHRQKILIHCNAGVSRSGTVLIAYLMASLKINFEQALAIAQDIRPCISPNKGFKRQLKSFDINYLSCLIN